MTEHQRNTINIEDKRFITEKTLGDYLKSIFGDNRKVISQKGLLNYKVDFYIPDYNLVVEYDGNEHFTRPDTFYNDRKREEDIKSAYGVRFIRFPYFFQLNKVVANHMFGEFATTEYDYNDYPMFYRWKGVRLPAQFCREGAIYEQTLIKELFIVEPSYIEEYYTTLLNWAIKKSSIFRAFNITHFDFLYTMLYEDVLPYENLDKSVIIENKQLENFRRELDIMDRYR